MAIGIIVIGVLQKDQLSWSSSKIGGKMANFRQIHVGIWKDAFFMNLTTEHKVLFIYLFSNEQANLCGLYKLPLKVILFETGLDEPTVREGFDHFKQSDKVHYDYALGVVWVVNMQKYHDSQSPKVITRRIDDILSIPDCAVKKLYLQHNIEYQYYMDTLSLKKENEKEKVNEKEDTKERKSAGRLKAPRPTQHPALNIYRELVRYHAPVAVRDQVIKIVGEDERALGLWRSTILVWIGRGWNPRNITGLLDVFQSGGFKDKNGRTIVTKPGIVDQELAKIQAQELEAKHGNPG